MSTPEKDESAASTVAVADTDTDADVAAETDIGPGTDAGPDTDTAGPGASAGSDAAPERRPRWWVAWLIRLAWLVGLIAVGIGLYLCYLHVSRTARVSSDGASNALQAWDMLHGNPLLRGWTVTDVSFYTTELPEYMLVETGPRPERGRAARVGGDQLHAGRADRRDAGPGARDGP